MLNPLKVKNGQVVGDFSREAIEDVLFGWVCDPDKPTSLRISALSALKDAIKNDALCFITPQEILDTCLIVIEQEASENRDKQFWQLVGETVVTIYQTTQTKGDSDDNET